MTGDTTAQYVWSPVYVDAMIERDRDADSDTETGDGGLEERLWVQQDSNWNVTALVGLVDADGPGGDPAEWQVVERYAYDPFGSVTIYSPTYGTVRTVSDYGFTQGFQGMFFDPVSGLYGSRFRDGYSPTLGRWTIADPLGFAAGDVNLYGFVGGNPGNYTDPSGLEKGFLGNVEAIYLGLKAAGFTDTGALKLIVSTWADGW